MSTVPIVFSFDGNMEMPAGVCLFSLLSHAEKDTFYDIFILHPEEVVFNYSRIRELGALFPRCRITFRVVDETFRDSFVIRGITATTYYRLLIPALIPEYDKIIYSDVDVIFREDLSKYYDLPIDDFFFAGVNSVPVMNADYLKNVKKIGLRPEDGYYYAGNIIINSKLLRDKKKVAEFLSHKDNHYLFQDMDILNICCNKQIKALPLGFCLTNDYYRAIIGDKIHFLSYYSEEEMDNAIRFGTVHYNGPKPWREVCMNMDIWWDYYRKSIFFDEKFAHDFWYDQTYRVEKMSLWKRIKQVARYFRKGGKM